MTLEELRIEVDAALAHYLADRRTALPGAIPLLDELERTIGSGGKRLRPAFCYWGYLAGGGEPVAPIVQAAASLELLHTFAIVHDDIMDGSDERRGIPTTVAKHGNAFALLAGDLALVLADSLFTASGFEPDALARAAGFYARMRQEVIAGQFEEMGHAEDAEVSVADARRIAVLKSGLYSVVEPVAIGAALADADDDRQRTLRSFSEPIGEAFQLRDDLLGTFGNRADVGKPTDSDMREGKRHVLFAFAARALTGAERDFLLTNWGRGDALSATDADRLRALLESSGARAATEALIEELSVEADAALAGAGLALEATETLRDLARVAVDRTS